MAEKPPKEFKLRLGILGAARHVPTSLLAPLQKNRRLQERLEVVAVAARDLAEADAFAKSLAIPKAYGSYEEMLADPNIDVIYNVLPNALRCRWSVSSLMAGKHVLSEAPLCCNAREALVLQRAAEDAGKVLLEGSHPTYHPLTKRIREMVREGKVGKLESIELTLPVTVSLHGSAVCNKVGALLGVGTYCVGLVRALSREEPRVVSATASHAEGSPDTDVSMSAHLSAPSGVKASFDCSTSPLKSGSANVASIKVTGSSGMIQAKEWFGGKGATANTIVLEQFDGCGWRSVESLDNPQPELRDTYFFQLQTFVNEVQAQTEAGSSGMPWDYTESLATPADSVRNMAVIDAIYRAAGMNPRASVNIPAAPYDHIGTSKL